MKGRLVFTLSIIEDDRVVLQELLDAHTNAIELGEDVL
jgi:hypothetical protein